MTSVAGMSLAIGALMASQVRPHYSAEARIRLLADHSTSFFSDAHSAADDAATIRAQYYVIRSPRILSAAAQKLDLPSKWQTDEAGAVARLKNIVTPRRVIDANVTEIHVTDEDPQLAADIANTVADVYITEANQPRFEQGQQMLQRLQRECDDQAERLRAAENQTQDIRQQLGMAIGQTQIAADTMLNPLRQQAAQAEAEAIESQIRLESMVKSQDDLILALQSAWPSDVLSQNLAVKLIDAEAKVADNESRYGIDHPRAQEARSELDHLMADAREQVDRVIDRAKVQQAAAADRATHARQRLEEAQHSVTSATGSYAELVAATQREEVQRNLQKLLTDRAQKLAVDLQMGGPAGELIESASAASSADLGTPRQILMMSLLIGLVAGAGTATLVDRMDKTIREPGDVGWQLSLPLLGIVGRQKDLLNASATGKNVEAYRMIRNSIDFADHTLRSLCVAGATAGEGASTTAANLAWTWAEHGARVLVIDANFRNPSVAPTFGFRSEMGLVDFLTSRRPISELMVQTAVANVWALPAGAVSRSGKTAAPPITPQQLSELLIAARSQADIILFDCAPILESSDTAIIARQCDATLLVCRQRHTPVAKLRLAVHILRSSGEGLLGAALTGVPATVNWDPPALSIPVISHFETSARRSVVAQTRHRRKDAA